jgi:hypothetical protein
MTKSLQSSVCCGNLQGNTKILSIDDNNTTLGVLDSLSCCRNGINFLAVHSVFLLLVNCWIFNELHLGR